MEARSKFLRNLLLVGLLLGPASGPVVAQVQISEHTDSSGKITVAVFERIAGTPQQHFTDFAVNVPEQFVVIGGGVEGSRVPNGHLITASYPNSDLSAWLVSTKDHYYRYPDPVAIKAWAIGLKIAGLTRQQLISMMAVSVASSGYDSQPDISSGVSENYVLLSGGIKVNYTEPGNIATATYPETAYTWRARSKDHILSSPASTQVYAIGLKQSIPGIGSIAVTTIATDSTYTNHPASMANMTPGYALTGCGARVDWTEPGNLLWKIKPATTGNQYGCEASSKDHHYASPATIRTYATGITLY
jgi:hypothetical protein